ncbi:MAG: hypothetical protein ACFFEF_15590 [Candidatus Thorarchaeota archaeon]
MEKRDSYYEKGVATCILCGEPLKGLEKVRYRGWWCHAECAHKSLEQNVDNFKKWPFWIGVLGTPSGAFLALMLLSMFLESPPLLNPWPIAIPFFGMAIGLAFQSVGFLGFYVSYLENNGVVLSVLAATSSIFHALVGFLLILNGYNPAYYDPILGTLNIALIPELSLSIIVAYATLALVMLLTAVVVMMLEGSIGVGVFNRALAILFVGLIAIVPLSPINIIVEFSAVTILFLSAGPPKSWKEVSVE